MPHALRGVKCPGVLSPNPSNGRGALPLEKVAKEERRGLRARRRLECAKENHARARSRRTAVFLPPIVVARSASMTR